MGRPGKPREMWKEESCGKEIRRGGAPKAEGPGEETGQGQETWVAAKMQKASEVPMRFRLPSQLWQQLLS